MAKDEDILAANAAFYAAFARGDAAAMALIWAEEDGISCIHPGWPAILGRAAVLGSWRDIFQGGAGPDIVCHEPHAVVEDHEARVLCIEAIGSHLLAACNHFRFIAGTWRLIHHQASPINTAPVAPAPSSKLH